MIDAIDLTDEQSIKVNYNFFPVFAAKFSELI